MDWVTIPSYYFYTGVGFISFSEIGNSILKILVINLILIINLRKFQSKRSTKRFDPDHKYNFFNFTLDVGIQ